MNSIFGRVNTDFSPLDKKLFMKSIEQQSVLPGLKNKVNAEGHWGFAQVLFTPFNINNYKDQAYSDFVIVSDVALYNRKELIDGLNLPNERFSDEYIILNAYIKWGKKCPDHFVGDFAFAIWNKKTNELFCARDHFGIKPFYYYHDQHKVICSSDILGIKAQPGLSLNIDEQYIADTISIVKSEYFRTTFKEIKKIPPAHYLFMKNNKIELKPYWHLRKQNILQEDDKVIIDKFKSILIESVKCRVDNNYLNGSELSGGLDSSTVTAIASKFHNVQTFSHILPDDLVDKIHPFKDERRYIGLLADYCNINNKHFIRSENTSLVESVNNVTNIFYGLTQQNFGIFSDHLYESANKENVSILLSGFGGDEMVTSKCPDYLFELARNKEWDELIEDLKSQNLSKFKRVKKILKIALKIKTPAFYSIIRLFRPERKWWQKKYKNLAIHKGFEKNLKIRKRYKSYYSKQQGCSLQEKNIGRITHPHVSQRLEYCSILARHYGLEYRYPLLDKRLVEFYLAVPVRMKARNGIGRYILRKATEGILPKEIQWRDDKSGATIPTVFMRMLNDKERISEIIKKAKKSVAVRKYIDIEQYEKWFYKLCHRAKKPERYINPGAFYNYLKLILFIEQNPELFK